MEINKVSMTVTTDKGEVKVVTAWKNSKNEVMLTQALEGLFPGESLFQLKDTMGLPLEFAVGNVLDSGFKIDWTSYIEKARKSDRWDYQTYAELQMLKTELKEYEAYFDEVIKRFKVYVLRYAHPALKGD